MPASPGNTELAKLNAELTCPWSSAAMLTAAMACLTCTKSAASSTPSMAVHPLRERYWKRCMASAGMQ